MSPKLSVFFVSVLLVAASATPQCDYRFRSSAPYRASILDLAIDGNDLWAASGFGVQLYDRSVDPPKLVASAALPGVTSIVRVANGNVYAAGTSGIAILRRNGATLQIVRTVAMTGVNDLLVSGSTIYVATSSGIVLLNGADLTQLSTISNTNASSLAASGSTIYAAEGDNTINVFSGTQKTGTITSQLRATSVETVGSRLYATDGFRTEIFTGSTSLGLLPYPARSIADLGSNVVMIAGNDRQLRAIDASVPQSFVELFDAELPPSGGTVNRVTSLQASVGRVYAGGGDIGLATFDVSHFAAPFPMRAYAAGATTSVVALPDAVYASLSAGGIREMTRNANGGLVVARAWDASEKPVVQDGSGSFLLTSNGAALTYWFLGAVTTPTVIATATFATPVRTAFFTGTATAIALLVDGTLWTVDLSQATPTPVRVASSYSTLTQLARSSAGIAATELSTDATSTTVHFWTAPNAAPIDVHVPGAATALALDASTAAVFTFRGITVIDFRTSSQTPLAGSNAAIATALAISGNKLIEQTQGGTVRVWDIASGVLEKEFAVPGGATDISAIAGSTTVGVSSGSGIATIDYGAASSQPVALARVGANSYYKKAVAGGGRLYLFDGRVIDIYTFAADTPVWSGSVLAPGTLDIAASDSALFTLSNTEVVTEYSSAGAMMRSQPLGEGSDVTPLRIATAGGAPWVAFSRGCTTSTCEERTDVLDPQSLVRTASLAGAVVDVATSGSRAFAIFGTPSEIRAYDVGDALHPSQLASAANANNAVAIAFDPAGTVYALGDKVYAYSTALMPSGSQLPPVKPATFAGMLIDAGCATIAGRSLTADTYALPAWIVAGSIPVPGNIRSMLLASGRLVFLTDYSIEVWSRTAAKPPVRRRAAGN